MTLSDAVKSIANLCCGILILCLMILLLSLTLEIIVTMLSPESRILLGIFIGYPLLHYIVEGIIKPYLLAKRQITALLSVGNYFCIFRIEDINNNPSCNKLETEKFIHDIRLYYSNVIEFNGLLYYSFLYRFFGLPSLDSIDKLNGHIIALLGQTNQLFIVTAQYRSCADNIPVIQKRWRYIKELLST